MVLNPFNQFWRQLSKLPVFWLIQHKITKEVIHFGNNVSSSSWRIDSSWRAAHGIIVLDFDKEVVDAVCEVHNKHKEMRRINNWDDESLCRFMVSVEKTVKCWSNLHNFCLFPLPLSSRLSLFVMRTNQAVTWLNVVHCAKAAKIDNVVWWWFLWRRCTLYKAVKQTGTQELSML